MSEKNGTWGNAQAVRGLAALNVGRDAEVDSIACASRGNCSAGGAYSIKTKNILADSEVFVVSEKNGVWGNAQTLPGFGALTSSFGGSLGGLVCKSVGNCSAAGHFFAQVGDGVFVSTEKNGVWGNATALPGLRALDVGRDASIPRLACGAPGDCSLGGFYGVHSPHGQQVIKPYLAVQKNGTWGKAKEVSGVEP